MPLPFLPIGCASASGLLGVPSGTETTGDSKAKQDLGTGRSRIARIFEGTERDSGIAFGASGSAENYAENVAFQAEQGHGFAAEKANNVIDRLFGKKAKLIGGTIEGGADRLVDGVEIQSKYCRSGQECIKACFRGGKFRYMSNHGPMKIEVPSDMHDSAVKAMENRIRNGDIPGVSDPGRAKEIVIKGHITYRQAKNIAQFGTIEGLKYDVRSGVFLTGTAMGISAAVTFAVSMWRGEEFDVALERSLVIGLKTGSVVWVGHILTAQAGRTGIEQGLRGGTDWAVRQLGPKATAFLANAGRGTGSQIYGAAAGKHLSKVMRGNVVAAAVATLVLSSADIARLFQGRISTAQAFKNVTTTGAGVAGGTAGWWGGTAAGAALGSVVPVIGTAVGGFIGGLIGSVSGGIAASEAADAILGEIFEEDDAEEMLGIVQESLSELSEDYLLGEEEIKAVIDELEVTPVKLRDMFESDDRAEFAKDWLLPLVRKQVENRERIVPPRIVPPKESKLLRNILEKIRVFFRWICWWRT